LLTLRNPRAQGLPGCGEGGEGVAQGDRLIDLSGRSEPVETQDRLHLGPFGRRFDDPVAFGRAGAASVYKALDVSA